MSRRFQFSLRAFLLCLVIFAIVIAKQRDALRDWLESIRAGKLVNQVLIVGPPSRKLFVPPSPDEIASALSGLFDDRDGGILRRHAMSTRLGEAPIHRDGQTAMAESRGIAAVMMRRPQVSLKT